MPYGRRRNGPLPGQDVFLAARRPCLQPTLPIEFVADKRPPSSRRVSAFAEARGLDLEPFQRRIVRTVATGTREVVVLLPRGDPKTWGLVHRHLVLR